jgi:uncharacterized integral membrane protein
MAVICLFVAILVVFAFQNLHIVTMTFLSFSARIPLAALAAGVYALGAVTGGSLLALLRHSIEGAKRH